MAAAMKRTSAIVALLLIAATVIVALIRHIFMLPALERAAYHGDHPRLIHRLERGDDPNRRTSFFPTKLSNMTPLRWAVRGRQPESIRVLLLHGASLESQSWPLLVTAMMFDCPECARAILEHGADPNATSSGTSVLRYALARRQARAALELIRAGADLWTGTQRDPGAVDMIVGSLSVEELADDVFHEIVQALLERGVSPDVEVFAASPHRGTLFMYAAQWAAPETVDLLLRAGAHVDTLDAQERTAFDYANARTDGNAEKVTRMLAGQLTNE